jgi:hypothetical protein
MAFYESDGKKGKPGQMALGHGGEQADNPGTMSKEGKSMVYILPPRKLPPKIAP